MVISSLWCGPNLGQNIPSLSTPIVFSDQNSRHGITSVAAYPEIVSKWWIIAQDIVGYEQQKRAPNVICFKVNIQIAYLLMLISQYIQLQFRTRTDFRWNRNLIMTTSWYLGNHIKSNPTVTFLLFASVTTGRRWWNPLKIGQGMHWRQEKCRAM